MAHGKKRRRRNIRFIDTNIILRIEYFGEKNLGFVDCLLAGYYDVENITIHTFDTKLEKLLAVITKTKN